MNEDTNPFPGRDREALREVASAYYWASMVAEGAYQLSMPPAVRQRALDIQDAALSRGLKPEHVKAYIEGRL